MPEFTERQSSSWPEAIAEAQQYVDSGTIHDYLDSMHWTVRWEEETRPGRGQAFNGTWTDGEYLVQILMDVYGYPSVSVASLSWEHVSSWEECECEPCRKEREEEDGR